MGIGSLASVDDVVSDEDGDLARGAALDEGLELVDEPSKALTENIVGIDSRLGLFEPCEW